MRGIGLYDDLNVKSENYSSNNTLASDCKKIPQFMTII